MTATCARCHSVGAWTGYGKGGIFCALCARVLALRPPWKVTK